MPHTTVLAPTLTAHAMNQQLMLLCCATHSANFNGWCRVSGCEWAARTNRRVPLPDHPVNEECARCLRICAHVSVISLQKVCRPFKEGGMTMMSHSIDMSPPNLIRRKCIA